MVASRYKIVDSVSGEVIRDVHPEELTSTSLVPVDNEIMSISDPGIMDMLNGKLPYHIQKLRDKHLSPDDEEFEMSLFTGGIPKPFDEYINKEITVLGAAIIPHGQYRAKSDPEDAPLRPGYLKFRFVISELDSNGNPIILETSGVEIFSHMTNALNAYGWFLWDRPRKYLITKGGKNGAYFMRNTERKYKPVPPTTVKADK